MKTAGYPRPTLRWFATEEHPFKVLFIFLKLWYNGSPQHPPILQLGNKNFSLFILSGSSFFFHHPQVETPDSKLWLMAWSHLINLLASQQSDSATSPGLHTTWLSKYFEGEKFHWCLGEVVKVTLMKKSHVDVLVKSSKLPWCIKALSMSWKKFKASSMAWWSHWSYFDEVKPHQCLGEVTKATLMYKSFVHVLKKSSKPRQSLGEVIEATLPSRFAVH